MVRETTIPRWAIGTIFVIITFFGSATLAAERLTESVVVVIEAMAEAMSQ